jgi:hypothetical protein
LPEVTTITGNVLAVRDSGSVFGEKFWQPLKGADVSGNTFNGGKKGKNLGRKRISFLPGNIYASEILQLIKIKNLLIVHSSCHFHPSPPPADERSELTCR